MSAPAVRHPELNTGFQHAPASSPAAVAIPVGVGALDGHFPPLTTGSYLFGRAGFLEGAP